jgi:hypothetical protein
LIQGITLRLVSATAIFLGTILVLSGCQAGGVLFSSAPPNGGYTGAPRPIETVKPAPPAVFVPDGSAAQNLPFFVSIVEQATAADPNVSSYDVAVLQSQSGFDPASIQFTYSRTAAGLASDSSSVAVLFAGECIIAQYGPVISGVHGVVLPALAQGGCLIGSQVQGL